MDVPSPTVLLDKVRALPAAAPLLGRLGDADGVYLVGGAVRDLLLGGAPYDLDFVVDGDVTELARRLGPAIVHDRFGTSTVTLDGFTYDFARARRETYERPGALPDVEPARIEDDLLRRDFTANAIAIGLGGEDAGGVRAAPWGLEDLDARRLRVLHAASFIDDPTRLLRLARYASRLRFEVEPGTLELARAAVDSGALQTVSGARIGAELRLLAREPDPVAAFQQLRELGLDEAIAPGFGLDDTALARRALALLPADGRPELLVLALAGRKIGDSELRSLLDALSFEARERDAITTAAHRAQPTADALKKARRASEIADAVAGSRPELVAIAGALGPAEQAGKWLQELRHVRLEIDGSDLTAAGVAQGPAIGEGLRAALAAKLDGAAAGRDQELSHALQAANASG